MKRKNFIKIFYSPLLILKTMKTNIITMCLLILTQTAFTQAFTETWYGAIAINENTKINFVFNIEKEGTTYQTTIDIPTQRVNGIEAINTAVKNDSLVIDLSNVGMKYSGNLSPNCTIINGKMLEGINSFVLNLSRNAVTKGKNKDFEIIELEKLNHLFQSAKNGKMEEYSEIEETFSPKALHIISDWILKRI